MWHSNDSHLPTAMMHNKIRTHPQPSCSKEALAHCTLFSLHFRKHVANMDFFSLSSSIERASIFQVYAHLTKVKSVRINDAFGFITYGVCLLSGCYGVCSTLIGTVCTSKSVFTRAFTCTCTSVLIIISTDYIHHLYNAVQWWQYVYHYSVCVNANAKKMFIDSVTCIVNDLILIENSMNYTFSYNYCKRFICIIVFLHFSSQFWVDINRQCIQIFQHLRWDCLHPYLNNPKKIGKYLNSL